MSTFDLTQPVKIVNPTSNVDGIYGYYNSLEEAYISVPEGLRKGGRTVGIKQDDGSIVEYWWENDNDLSDAGLVPKTIGSNGSGSYFKEITKDGEFTAEKITGGVNDGKYTFKITGNETLEWTIGDTDHVYNLDSNDEWKYIADVLGSGVERRIDAVSYGNDGQIHYWKGTETGQASYPNVPETHILKTFVTLTEDGVIIPSPTDLSGYVLKNHFKWGSSVYSVGSGNDVYLIAGSIVGYHNKVVGITNLYPNPELRILGCNIDTVLTNKPLWDGVTIHIKFSLVAGKTIRLKNNISGANVPTQAKFLFPNGLDYLPANNEILTFVLRDTGFFGWKLEFAGSNMSSGGGVTGDFIPLSGTEVGKPLTGGIEISNDGGFYSVDGDSGRAIGMSSDNIVIENFNSDFGKNSFFVLNTDYNQIGSENLNENSNLNQTPKNTTITTTDAYNNKAEIVVGGGGTVRFNSDIPDEGWSGYMFYNYEEGLNIVDNNINSYSNLRYTGISGNDNVNNWQISKDGYDSNDSNLLFPDSGSTPRRIPVSVNGNYANQQGDIEIEIGGGTSDDISNESTVTGATVTEALDELQEQLGALVNLTNDDNTLIIDGNIIRLNVTNITEQFTANGVDRNFEMTNVYTSIENVFINGVRIKSSDYITISEQEIEIKTTVTLLLGDEVVIQGTMFVVE